MSIKHNRIKVSDLEKNQPNKILITNESGELEFSDFSNAATEFRKENFEFTGSKIFVLSQPAVNVLSVVVDGITLNGTAGAPLQYRMNSSTQLEILDEMILEEDIWVSITYNYTGSINSSNGVQSVTGEGVDNTDPQNPVIRINSGAIVEDQIVDGVTDKGASQNAVFDALLLKADDGNVLHKTTNETFTGTKSANNSGSNVFNGMIFNQVNGSGTPLRSTNSATGSAIELINNGTSQAAFIGNYTSGTGVNIFNNGSGTGLHVNNNGSGNGVQINITGATNPNKKSLLITDNTDSNNGYLVSLEYGSGAAASLPFRVTRAGTTTYSITNTGIVTASLFKTLAGLPNQSLQADGSLFDLSSKVDKEVGKSLLADTEISRLAALSNYTHPANHPASIITQDASNRFVTDAEKATWNAKQASLGFVPENIINKNVANGYAGLGADGKLISSQLPSITLNDTFVTASQTAMLALTVQTGDIAVRTDLNKSFILKGDNPTLLSDWQELLTPTSAVTTVFGRNGAIVSQTGDYTADQISETTTRKFQSANQQAFNDATSSIQTQLNAKQANIAAGTTAQYFRGDKTWQTLDKAAAGLANVDNTTDAVKNVLSATKLTTARTINGTAFDGSANIIITDSTKENNILAGTNTQYFRGDKSWQNLDKTAVGLANIDNTSDANKPVSTATQAALNLKASLTSPPFTGIPTAPTATPGTNTTQLATTAYVDAKVTNTIVSGVNNIAPSQSAVFDALALKAPLSATQVPYKSITNLNTLFTSYPRNSVNTCQVHNESVFSPDTTATWGVITSCKTDDAGDYGIQTYVAMGVISNTYVRNCQNGVWSAWTKLN